MIVENTLEQGFLAAIWDFITMQLQLTSIFYTFSLGTRSHYFERTILHGGAKYRATGRGFMVQHKNFSENYRLYARSHFIKAIELGLILTVYAAYSPVAKGTFTYIALTISSWFLVFSWIMAPFVFNPSGFDWLKTMYDFNDFMKWIWFQGGVFAKSEQSWERWWYEEQDHMRNTGLWGKLLEIILDLRFFFFQYGIIYQLGIAAGSKSVVVYILSWIYVVVDLGLYSIIIYARDRYSAREHIYYRLVQFLVIILGVLIITALMEFTQFKFLDIFTSLLAFVPTGWGFLLIAQVFRPILEKSFIWGTVVYVARTYDIMFGVIVLTPVAVLSWMSGFQSMQTESCSMKRLVGVCGYSRLSLERNLKLNSDLRRHAVGFIFYVEFVDVYVMWSFTFVLHQILSEAECPETFVIHRFVLSSLVVMIISGFLLSLFGVVILPLNTHRMSYYNPFFGKIVNLSLVGLMLILAIPVIYKVY